MVRNYLPKDVAELAQWYQRYLSPIALVLGFIADNLILLKRVDFLQTHLILGTYLLVAASGILFLHAAERGKVRGEKVHSWLPIVPVIVQFAFGGLFGGYLSLYSRSAALASTWIFVAALGLLLVGNERFYRLYSQYAFQVALYFAVLLGYFTFMVPLVLSSIGPFSFVVACAASVGAITLFLFMLSWITPELSRRELTRTARSIAAILAIFSTLYFTNSIPPLPLALKDAGVYHSVSRGEDGIYRLEREEQGFLERFFGINTVFHQQTGDRAYVFTAVFAPTGLSTPIIHEWQYFNATISDWITTDTLSFTINGGRDGGYRGYSRKGDLAEGEWRVNVLTGYGQLIGRVAFTVVAATTSPLLIAETR